MARKFTVNINLHYHEDYNMGDPKVAKTLSDDELRDRALSLTVADLEYLLENEDISNWAYVYDGDNLEES